MITVNTNMASLIAQNSFNKCTNSMNKALERLSTGYRINSSKDDAAGSAIATKLETKISSYAQATKNAEMGADYLQSADSTLTTMQNMVQRMRDLTEQAANGTYGADERKALQAEVDGLKAELYRIKNTTEFNGKKILGEEYPIAKQLVVPDVKMSEITSFAGLSGKTVGISSADDLVKLSTLTNSSDSTGISFVLTNDIDMSSVPNFTPIGTNSNPFNGTFEGNGFTISKLKVDADLSGLFGLVGDATINNVNLENVDIKSTSIAGGLVAIAMGKLSIENCLVAGNVSGSSLVGGLVGYFYGSASNKNISNCSSNCNVTTSGDAAGGLIGMIGVPNVYVENCSASGEVVGKNAGGFVGQVVAPDVNITNCVSYVSSVTSNGTGGTVGAFAGASLPQVTYSNCAYKINAGLPTDAIGTVMGTPIDTPPQAEANPKNPIIKPKPIIPEISVPTNLQVGIQADQNSVISIDTGFAMGGFDVDLSTDTKARASLDEIDALMDRMTAKKTDIGASLNRLESVMAQQETMRTSMTSALSQIKDADIAKESANYVKNQILQQTTASLLATANQNPNIALNLL